MKVSLLVPYRSDEGHRNEAWSYCLKRWNQYFPEFELVIGNNEGDFSRSAAINQAAHQATGEVFVIADCDTTFESPSWIHEALQIETWVLAGTYQKLDQASSRLILDGDLSLTNGVSEATMSTSWSGIVIVPREGFETVQGFDERFTRWGEEDSCFGLCLNELWRQNERIPGVVNHLWHPQPLSETYGNPEHGRQHALGDEYRAAVGNPEQMRLVRNLA